MGKKRPSEKATRIRQALLKYCRATLADNPAPEAFARGLLQAGLQAQGIELNRQSLNLISQWWEEDRAAKAGLNVEKFKKTREFLDGLLNREAGTLDAVKQAMMEHAGTWKDFDLQTEEGRAGFAAKSGSFLQRAMHLSLLPHQPTPDASNGNGQYASGPATKPNGNGAHAEDRDLPPVVKGFSPQARERFGAAVATFKGAKFKRGDVARKVRELYGQDSGYDDRSVSRWLKAVTDFGWLTGGGKGAGACYWKPQN